MAYLFSFVRLFVGWSATKPQQVLERAMALCPDMLHARAAAKLLASKRAPDAFVEHVVSVTG